MEGLAPLFVLSSVPKDYFEQLNPFAQAKQAMLFTVSLIVGVTGSCAGIDISQVLPWPTEGRCEEVSQFLFATIALPGFDNVMVTAVKTNEVQIGVPARQFSFFDVKSGKFVVAQAERDMWIGGDVMILHSVGE
jgi:hypothetical protein